MAEVKGTEQLSELIDGLKVLAIAGKKVLADGKIGIGDLAVLTDLMRKQETVVKAFAGLAEMGSEVADLSGDEAIALIGKLIASAKEFQAA